MIWVWISLSVAAVLSLPFLRLLIKRLILHAKLKSALQAAGGRLIAAHSLWLFGGRNGKTCDFYLETPDRIYAVKLFTVLFKTTNLFFSDFGSYRAEYYIPAFGRWGTVLSLPIPSKERPLPDYDFTAGMPEAAGNKTFFRTLLIHPACFEIHRTTGVRKTELIYAGDTVNGIHIQSLSALIKELQDKTKEQRAIF